MSDNLDDIDYQSRSQKRRQNMVITIFLIIIAILVIIWIYFIFTSKKSNTTNNSNSQSNDCVDKNDSDCLYRRDAENDQSDMAFDPMMEVKPNLIEAMKDPTNSIPLSTQNYFDL